ncbi:hypothetical protein ES705_25603 [subsurface metagenome]
MNNNLSIYEKLLKYSPISSGKDIYNRPKLTENLETFLDILKQDKQLLIYRTPQAYVQSSFNMEKLVILPDAENRPVIA